MAKEKDKKKDAEKPNKPPVINIKALLLFRFNIIAPICFLAVLGLGYYFFIKPRIDFLTNKTKETDQAYWSEELQKKKLERDKVKVAVDRFENIKEFNLESLNTILPEGMVLRDMMDEVKSVVESAGLELNQITVSEQEGGTIGLASHSVKLPPSVKKAVINITVSGLRGYEGLKVFLRRIEENVRLYDVTSFPTITDEGSQDIDLDGARKEDIQYSFTIQTYFLSP